MIIYDVETEYKKEEICSDLIFKNFDHLNEEERKDLKDKISFEYQFKNKENRTNWVVQMPGKQLSFLLNKGKIYMQWRTE
jgi:glycogen synthase